jgi:hypothetical protein
LELQGAGSDERRFNTTGLQALSVVLAMTSELQGAGSDGGRNTVTDLQVWKALASNTEDLQATSEAGQVSLERHGVNGDAGGDEGRITSAGLQSTPDALAVTAECAPCGDVHTVVGLCAHKAAEGAGAQAARCRAWRHDRTTTADLQVAPEARPTTAECETAPESASMTSELQFADSVQVRTSATGLRRTSDGLAATLELQGAGSDEGHTAVTGLFVNEGVEQAGVADAAASVQPGAAAVQRAAVVVQADSIAWQKGFSGGLAQVVSRSSELQGAGGAVGRISAAGVQVTPKGLSMNSEVQDAGSGVGRTDTTGMPALNRRTRRAAASAVAKHSAGAAAAGARGEEELQVARIRAAVEGAFALLQDFTTCGCGGVGSTVAHRRAQRRRQAKAAAVAAGLAGNKYAVLSVELEVDEASAVPLLPDSGRTQDCSGVLGKAEAAEAPWCGRCADTLADFVCPVRELCVLLEVVRVAAHCITTCPSAKEGRRRLARLEQMMVCAELEERVCAEGSPTFRATLAEIQLFLLA